MIITSSASTSPLPSTMARLSLLTLNAVTLAVAIPSLLTFEILLLLLLNLFAPLCLPTTLSTLCHLSAILLCCALYLSKPTVDEHSFYNSVFLSDPNASQVLIFAYPSAGFLDWSSPTTLAWTAVVSEVKRHLLDRSSAIGHAQFAWYCKGEGKEVVYGASGQSGLVHGQDVEAVFNGWGLSVLQLVFTDGIFESEARVRELVKQSSTIDHFGWVGFKVPHEQCRKVAEYVAEYEKHKAYENYGFPPDPLKYEGGGCTSYTNAALVRSGLDLPFLDAWKRHYYVPDKWLGRAKLPKMSKLMETSHVPKEERVVSAVPILFNDEKWADPSDRTAFKFEYYDPELFYNACLLIENAWLKHKGMPLKESTRGEFEASEFEEALEKKIDEFVKRIDLSKAVQRRLHQTTGLVVDLS